MGVWTNLRRVLRKFLRMGRTAESSTEEQTTRLVMRGSSADSSLTVGAAKEMIFDRLCREYKARGAGAGLEGEALRKELGLPEDLFRWALTEMTYHTTASGLYVDRDYTGKRLSLGMRGRARCDDGVNPFATGKAAEKEKN